MDTEPIELDDPLLPTPRGLDEEGSLVPPTDSGDASSGRELRRRSSFSTIVLPKGNVVTSSSDLPAADTRLTYENFRSKMHQKVCKLLRPVAEETDLARLERLKGLFNDLTCQVEEIVTSKLAVEGHPTTSPAAAAATIPSRYYQILAELYVQQPDPAQELLRVGIPMLWNNVHFQVTFALVFYQWLFENCYDDPDRSIKYFAMLIKGAHKLFWLDVENGTRRFSTVHAFFVSRVLLDESRWRGLIRRKYCELFDLVCKFYFYYEDTNNLDKLLSGCQQLMESYADELDRPAAHAKINAINMFTNEVVRTMRLIKNEAALIQYVRCCAALRDNLAVPGRKTKLRLYSLLLDLSTPGYPLYPTRQVKTTAQTTLRQLFPTPLPAWIIHFTFRLLRPLSFVSWFNLRVTQLWVLALTFLAWIVAVVPFVGRKWSVNVAGAQQQSPPPTHKQPSGPPSSPPPSPPQQQQRHIPYRSRLAKFLLESLRPANWWPATMRARSGAATAPAATERHHTSHSVEDTAL